MNASAAMDSSPVSGGEHVVDYQPYIYSPLPADDSFRCLELQPGSDDEPLRCSIRISAVTDATYEAISYVWGSEIRDRRIYCNDRSIYITTNLFQALQRLRSPNEVRHLWADSVCIDQDNLEEKGHQVSIMGQIYSSARRVLIYMGSDPEGHGPKLASLLSEVHDLLQREIAKLTSLDWNCFPNLHKDTNNPLLHDERWWSYIALFDPEWFDRGWVVREAGLAKEGLIIWGNSSFPWASLMNMILWIVGKNVVIPALPSSYQFGLPDKFHIHMNTYWDRYSHTLRIFFPSSYNPLRRLLDYLANGRYLQFKDRRDNIYAFLDLAIKSIDQLRLTPDYTQSSDEVFEAFAVQFLYATGDITILDYVVNDMQSLQSDQPSWAPRWDAIEPRYDHQFWRNISATLQEAESFKPPQIINGRVLKVRGVVLDNVHFVSEVLQASTTTPEVTLRLWQEVQSSISQINRPIYYPIEHFIAVLLHDKCVVRNLEEDERLIDSYIEEMMRRVNEVGEYAQSSEREQLPEFDLVQSCIQSYSSAKRFMITGRGYIGLAPASAREGDVCVRLFGSQNLPPTSLYLLRAMEPAQHYKLVGPAWSLFAIHANNDADSEQESRDRNSDNDDEEPDQQGVSEPESSINNDGEQTVEEQDFYLC